MNAIRRLLQEVVAACASAEATYWALAKGGRTLEARMNAGPAPEKLEGLEVPVEGSLVGLVLCTGLPTALGPEADYHPTADAATGVETVAMAAAPVRLRGQAVGVLSTINPAGRSLFTAGDLEAVQWKAFLLGCLLEHLQNDA